MLAGAGAAIVVGLLGYLMFLGLSVEMRTRIEQPLALLDIQPIKPKPTPKPHVESPKSKAASGKASPRNLKNKATDVVVPPPLVKLPPPPPIVSAPRAGVGMAASNGASDRPGPGQGAGGEGDGTGSGGSGNGDGAGDLPPRQIGGRLKYSDIPPDLREAGIGGTVGVRYQVEADGQVGDCRVTSSSGSAELDAQTCRLIQQRFRFKPSRDPEGRPVRSTIVESHGWFNESDDETPRP